MNCVWDLSPLTLIPNYFITPPRKKNHVVRTKTLLTKLDTDTGSKLYFKAPSNFPKDRKLERNEREDLAIQ